jgi:hypothetical protein
VLQDKKSGNILAGEKVSIGKSLWLNFFDLIVYFYIDGKESKRIVEDVSGIEDL